MMNLVDVLGCLGAIVGTSTMFPQLIKTLGTKRVHDVSLLMLILYFLNCLLRLSYGYMMRANPIILCNLIAGLISLTNLILWFRYK